MGALAGLSALPVRQLPEVHHHAAVVLLRFAVGDLTELHHHVVQMQLQRPEKELVCLYDPLAQCLPSD